MAYFSNPRHVLFAGVILVVLCAWFSTGYHHPDEHYQIWEFAKYKLGEAPVEDLPWEFPEQMRPGLQPFIAYSAILGARSLGIEDPFFQVFLTRLVSGLLAFFLYWKFADVLAPSLNDNGKLLRLCLAFFWIFPYLNVRFSSENLSAICFIGAILLIYPKPNLKTALPIIAAGFLLCISFFFRYQIAFAGIGLAAWLVFVEKVSLKTCLYLAVGAFLGLIIGLAADFWLYDGWVIAPYNYFAQNIIEDKAAGFGVSPWWWYFTATPLFFLPPLSLLLFWFMGVGIKRHPWHVFVWCLLPFVVGHSMVGHKEIRFLFPMIFPIFYLSCLGFDYVKQQGGIKKWVRVLFKVSVVINVIALILRTYYPANDRITNVQFLRDYSAKNPDAVVFVDCNCAHRKEALTLHFFETPWIHFVPTDSISQLNQPGPFRPKTGDLIYFKTKQTDFAPTGGSTTLVFKWFPEWLLKCNINNWVDRTRIWSVYRIEMDTPQ